MAPAVAIVSEEVVNLVDLQQTDVVAKVDDDGHLELVGDTYGDGHVELIELVLAAGVGLYLCGNVALGSLCRKLGLGIHQEGELNTALQRETFAEIDVGHHGNCHIARLYLHVLKLDTVMVDILPGCSGLHVVDACCQTETLGQLVFEFNTCHTSTVWCIVGLGSRYCLGGNVGVGLHTG